MKLQILIALVGSVFGVRTGLREQVLTTVSGAPTCPRDVACDGDDGMPCPAGMSGNGGCVKLGCLVIDDNSTVKVTCGKSNEGCIPGEQCTMVWGENCAPDIACNGKKTKNGCPSGMVGNRGACINPACVLTKTDDTVYAQCGSNTCLPNAQCP